MRVASASARAAALLGALLLPAATTAWETVDDAAAQAAQRIFDKEIFGVGTFASRYADDHPIEQLRGQVIASPDYFAPCFANGDLLMLAMPVSQHWHNALASPQRNASFSIGSNPDPHVVDPRHARSAAPPGRLSRSHSSSSSSSSRQELRWDPKRPDWRRGMPSKNRMTLFGHVQDLEDEDEKAQLQRCFLASHPDAAHWAPGSEESPHQASWVRFVVDNVYHVGGFGDEHWIGFIPIDKYASAVQLEARKHATHHSRRPIPPVEELHSAQDLFAPSQPLFQIQN